MKNKRPQLSRILSWERRHPVCLNVRDHVAGRQDACAPSLWKVEHKNPRLSQITQTEEQDRRPGFCKECQASI